MAKNKIRKFSELNSFSNVIQPPTQHALTYFAYKGRWGHDYFDNDHPIILEIGCGKGEYTIGLAQAFPKNNFIGIDIKGDRIWKGAKDALDNGFHHVSFLRIQAENLPAFFGKDEVSGIWLTFPDPHLRQSRSKKRLTSPRFLDIYRQILKPNSHIHLKTDNPELFYYTLGIIREEGHMLSFATSDLYTEKTVDEPLVKEIQTYYEKKFLPRGLPIHYLKFALHHA